MTLTQGIAAAADDRADGRMVGAAGTEATGISSKQVEPADSWFHLEALDLNVYGLSYHPDREAVHQQGLDN